ncbi:hypothetical protein BDW59DRAFT_179796 [Aspergillus cavernicola]|uniref:FAD-binding PCMH-type domain-containing protein n=1 Tax=Aspergillus cavernicola TaxID=176166 RepID=A0ABR4IDL1_9EURO
MTSSLPPKTYSDPEYEAAHRQTFAAPKAKIPTVLPIVASVFVGEALAHYVDPYDVYEDNESRRRVPRAAVTPGSLDELRQVLKIANKHGIPLWTFSRGKNLGYGGPAPVVRGSIALDLHRMNRILEVNDDIHYAVVEPGVTWTDLYNYCVENKKKVWPSTPSLGWGSVIGNTVDRGTGFGDARRRRSFRTGQFGISNSPSAFLSKFTYGPSIEGLFWQSNLGIVTKMSIWLTPQPSAFMSCVFNMPEFDDLEVMVDTLGLMRRNGVIPNVIWVGNVVEALCIRGRRRDFWKGEGPIPDWRVKELQKELNLGYWTAHFGLYGPERVVQAHFDEIRETLKEKAPTGDFTGKLFTGDKGGLLDAASVPFEDGNVLVGVPSLMSIPLMSWPLKEDGVGKAAHGDYAPIIPSSGKRLLDWMRRAKPLFEASGLELMTDFFMHDFDQHSPVEREAMHRLSYALHAEAKENGYGMYRGHIQHMDLIADLNDFNNHAYTRFIETLKDAIDPNGILSPGKQGIWPRKYRHMRGKTGNTAPKQKL